MLCILHFEIKRLRYYTYILHDWSLLRNYFAKKLRNITKIHVTVIQEENREISIAKLPRIIELIL